MSLGSRGPHWWGWGSWDAGIRVPSGQRRLPGKGAPCCSSLRPGWVSPAIWSEALEWGPRVEPAGGAQHRSLVSRASPTTAFTVQGPAQRMPPSQGSWAPPA